MPILVTKLSANMQFHYKVKHPLNTDMPNLYLLACMEFHLNTTMYYLNQYTLIILLFTLDPSTYHIKDLSMFLIKKLLTGD